MRWTVLEAGMLLGLAAGSLAHAANPSLIRAEALLEARQYRAAEAALDEAWQAPGNDRESLLRILEHQGLVAGFLNQPARAEDAFRKLLELDPGHRLGRDYAPRVREPFRSAQAWLELNAPLRVAVIRAPSAAVVSVTSDPLELARSVRFHLRPEPAAPFESRVIPLTAQRAQAEAPAGGQWWAELLGEREAVLVAVGSAEKPIDIDVPLARLSPRPTSVPIGDASQLARPSASVLRPIGYGLLAAGAASAAVGTIFALQARSEHNQLAGVAQNAQGVVIGMSQPQAYQLDSRMHSNATLANVLFGAGAACGVGGAVLWGFGGSVRVTPAAGGVSVSGHLP